MTTPAPCLSSAWLPLSPQHSACAPPLYALATLRTPTQKPAVSICTFVPVVIICTYVPVCTASVCSCHVSNAYIQACSQYLYFCTSSHYFFLCTVTQHLCMHLQAKLPVKACSQYLYFCTSTHYVLVTTTKHLCILHLRPPCRNRVHVRSISHTLSMRSSGISHPRSMRSSRYCYCSHTLSHAELYKICVLHNLISHTINEYWYKSILLAWTARHLPKAWEDSEREREREREESAGSDLCVSICTFVLIINGFCVSIVLLY